jgi:nitroreductase
MNASGTLDQQALTRCVRAAILAPSLHNSQPWRFRITDDGVEMFADRARRLEVLDPSGRELLISVGAALFTLRVAIRREGRIPAVTLLPDPARPDLIATVRPGEAAEPSAALLGLAGAITRRHTNRRPFQPFVVPADVVEELQTAAEHEGAALHVANHAVRTMVAGLGRVAEERLRASGGYHAELERWTRPVAGRRDGIPPTAFGPWDALERLPVRDFGLVHPQPWQHAEQFEPYPTIAVLTTTGDEPADWVRAGQALQRVLLTATRRHLATTPISQPVEIPAIREQLSDVRGGRWAQMVIRLGYGVPAAATPRRPLADILEETTA